MPGSPRDWFHLPAPTNFPPPPPTSRQDCISMRVDTTERKKHLETLLYYSLCSFIFSSFCFSTNVGGKGSIGEGSARRRREGGEEDDRHGRKVARQVKHLGLSSYSSAVSSVLGWTVLFLCWQGKTKSVFKALRSEVLECRHCWDPSNETKSRRSCSYQCEFKPILLFLHQQKKNVRVTQNRQ